MPQNWELDFSPVHWDISKSQDEKPRGSMSIFSNGLRIGNRVLGGFWGEFLRGGVYTFPKNGSQGTLQEDSSFHQRGRAIFKVVFAVRSSDEASK